MIRVGKVTVAQWLSMKRPSTIKSYIAVKGRLWRLRGFAVYADGGIDPILWSWGLAGKAAFSAARLDDPVYLCQYEESLEKKLLSEVKMNGLANVPPDCFALRGGDGDAPSDQASTVNSMHHAWSLTGSTSDPAP